MRVICLLPQFQQRVPEIHLFAARFKEQNVDIDGARAAYQLVHTEISPGLLEAIIKHANMEHRLVSLCKQYVKGSCFDKLIVCVNLVVSIGFAGQS